MSRTFTRTTRSSGDTGGRVTFKRGKGRGGGNGGGGETPTPTEPPPDTTPDAITFTPVTGAELSTPTASNNVTPTSFDAATPLTVDVGLEYSTDNGSTWASADTLFAPGTTLRVRLTSSANPNTPVTKGGSLGGVAFTFTVTTGDEPPPAGTLVSTSAELLSTLNAAVDGDVIRVAAGNYAQTTITGKVFGSDVTIRANDAGNPPIFDGLWLRSCAHIALEDIVAIPGGSPPYGISLVDCDDITVTDCVARKATDLGTYLGGHGMFIRRCDRVTVTGCEFKWTQYGIAHLDCNFLTITGCDFHDLGTDGIQGGGSCDVEIYENRFYNFYTPDTHHPDAIQFWTTNVTRRTERINIHDNLIYRGAGDPMQGVFFGDKYGLSWKTITIQRNAVVGAMFHGIRISALSSGPWAEGVTFRDNFVLGFTGQRSWISGQYVIDLTMGDNQYSYLNNSSVTTLTDEGGNVKLTEATSVGDYTLLDAWLTTHTDVPARA